MSATVRLAALAAVLPACVCVAGEPAPGRLELTNGDYLSGRWKGGDAEGVVRWQPGFADGEYEFPWGSVSRVALPKADAFQESGGAFGFELAGGDVLHGDLQAVDAEWLTVRLASVGEESEQARLRRSRVQRVFRRGTGDGLIYAGLQGLAGWTTRQADAWRSNGAGLATSRKNASAELGLDLPDQLTIEVELSWRASSAFRFELGYAPTPPDDTSGRNRRTGLLDGDPPAAFSLQVVDGWLVATREVGSAADLAPLMEVGQEAGRASLLLAFDNRQGTLVVESAEGKRLARLEVAGGADRRLTAFRLVNLDGGVELDRLRVRNWDQAQETVANQRGLRLVLEGGRVFDVELVGFDAGRNTFSVRPVEGQAGRLTEAIPGAESAGDGAVLIASERVVSMAFPAAETPPEPETIVLLHSDERLSGRVLGVVDGRLRVQSVAFEAPLFVPFDRVGGVVHAKSNQRVSGPTPTTGLAQLETNGSRVTGTIDGGLEGGPATLLWKPTASSQALPISLQAKGQIRFQQDGDRAQATLEPTAATPAVLCLRNGNRLPCSVGSINELGVEIDSPCTPTRLVPGKLVKAIELVTEAGDESIASERRVPLLTLPRALNDDPPGHLLVSTRGDYLRCDLKSLDGQDATVALGADESRIDRSAIARIIWFDPPPGSGSPAVKAASVGAAVGQQLEAVNDDGTRLKFTLESVRPEPGDAGAWRLHGREASLGACSIGLRSIDTLRFGGDEQAAEQGGTVEGYDGWVMRLAKEPRYQPEPPKEKPADADPFIGSPAPEIDLPIAREGRVVEGERFRVADYRGKVLVLDFWATWCGPCMRAMPMIDRLSEEFADRGVRVAAVNLEQPPEAVQATLTRLGISPLVALDADRSAAAKYRVGGIPHTVVVGRGGRVRRVFVGGGPGFEIKLRKALEEAVAHD